MYHPPVVGGTAAGGAETGGADAEALLLELEAALASTEGGWAELRGTTTVESALALALALATVDVATPEAWVLEAVLVPANAPETFWDLRFFLRWRGSSC